MAPAVVLPLLARLRALVALAVLLLRRPRKKRRKRVRSILAHARSHSGGIIVLISVLEKEESDEDMGFGLFD